MSVSQNSKRDAETWLKAQRVKVPRIEVFRLGDDIKIAKPIKPADPVYTSSGLKGQDYVLTVGTVELKKNHMLLYYVYKLAHSRGIELPKLVVVGRQGWMSEPVVELMNKDPEVRDRFVLLHDASDEELSWLYDHALFTVLPSFYEGWGIPIAESVARGVPCLCSSTSSMVEIAEDCVEHFNPASTDECLDGMVRMLKPGELARQRKQTGKYVGHTWDDSYAQIRRYINIYVRK